MKRVSQKEYTTTRPFPHPTSTWEPKAIGILVQICSPGFQDDMADSSLDRKELTGLPWLQFDIMCSRTRTCGEMLRSATSQDSAEDIAGSKCGEDVENIMLFAELIGEQFLVELVWCISIRQHLPPWENKACHHWRKARCWETLRFCSQWQSCVSRVWDQTLPSKMTTRGLSGTASRTLEKRGWNALTAVPT